jgi:hypothetical protein
MEVSTSPVKWKFIKEHQQHIQERASRTKISLLNFTANGECEREDFFSQEQLRRRLNDPNFSHDPEHARLFVVEDLSRDMIEFFGAKYDINPGFFQGQISDYLWYNTRDPWVEQDELPHGLKERNFFNLRYMQPMYFKDKHMMDRALVEAGSFNVLRRFDNDNANIVILDAPDSKVSHMRSKASLWIRENGSKQSGTVGKVYKP